MDKSLLRPKRIEWTNGRGDKFVYLKIDDQFYSECINNESNGRIGVAYINPYLESNARGFFLDYIKAFDKACFNEELEQILYE